MSSGICLRAVMTASAVNAEGDSNVNRAAFTSFSACLATQCPSAA